MLRMYCFTADVCLRMSRDLYRKYFSFSLQECQGLMHFRDGAVSFFIFAWFLIPHERKETSCEIYFLFFRQSWLCFIHCNCKLTKNLIRVILKSVPPSSEHDELWDGARHFGNKAIRPIISPCKFPFNQFSVWLRADKRRVYSVYS
jgi:hypothetical protein